MSKPHDLLRRIISRRLFKLFLTVPAISAKFVGVDADRINHIVKTMIAKRGKVKFLANFIDHILIFFTVGVGIFAKNLLCRFTALKLFDNTPCDKLHF